MGPLEYLGWRVPYIPDGDNLDMISRQWCRKYPHEAVKGAMKRILKGRPGRIEFTEEESNEFKNKVSEFLSGLPMCDWYDYFEC